MRAYLALCVMYAREAFEHRSTIIGYIVLWCLRVIVLIAVYSFAFKMKGGSLNGMDVVSTMWSIGVYFMVLSLQVRHVAKEISKEIRLGIVETRINKPFNYLIGACAIQLGRGMPLFLFSAPFIIFFSFLVLGAPHISFSTFWIFQTLTLFLGGLILAFLFYGIIGLCAVWLQETEPLYWILDKMVMVLGGAYVPIALLPFTVRVFAENTPFGSIMSVTHIFNPGFSDQWLRLWIVQSVWVCLFICLAAYTYRRAIQDLSVNGG